ncbi:LysR family transcriptional regulator [Bosea sp. ANAM02]|uniref:LysR family transcriptional regulator n=1 Tax=Bosea sp. ANAM02 TaxID=2020412 RepID=UPI00140F456D|nr:LysR family transcriptional regulator [Bosea sp. ANAM02]BCB18153.1 LysR family transcriptional regulator [Bosea sp. ANAM02]
MELKWLEDVLSLSSTLSFSRAARERNITQSALSRRVKQLEDWLGSPLFDRSSYPIRLTEAGRTFLPRAQEILRQVQGARQELRQMHEIATETLIFSTLNTLSLTYFPGLIRRMEERLGPLKTRFCEQRSSFDGNVALLDRGECDFLLTYAHEAVLPELDPERFTHRRLGAERAIPVSIPDGSGEPLHAFRSGDAPVRLLSYGSSTFFARRLAQLFAERPTPLVTVYENPMSIGLKAMVLAGRGVAWVPESLIVEELRSGQLVPAADTSWYITAEIRLYRPRQQGRLPVEQFWTALGESGLPARPQGAARAPVAAIA